MKWKETRWYSRLIAIIFFVGILPVFFFHLGMEYVMLDNLDSNEIVEEKQEITEEGRMHSVKMPDGTARLFPIITEEEATQLFIGCEVKHVTDAHAGTFLTNDDKVTFVFEGSVDYGWLANASKKAFWCFPRPGIGIE